MAAHGGVDAADAAHDAARAGLVGQLAAARARVQAAAVAARASDKRLQARARALAGLVNLQRAVLAERRANSGQALLLRNDGAVRAIDASAILVAALGGLQLQRVEARAHGAHLATEQALVAGVLHLDDTRTARGGNGAGRAAAPAGDATTRTTTRRLAHVGARVGLRAHISALVDRADLARQLARAAAAAQQTATTATTALHAARAARVLSAAARATAHPLARHARVRHIVTRGNHCVGASGSHGGSGSGGGGGDGARVAAAAAEHITQAATRTAHAATNAAHTATGAAHAAINSATHATHTAVDEASHTTHARPTTAGGRARVDGARDRADERGHGHRSRTRHHSGRGLSANDARTTAATPAAVHIGREDEQHHEGDKQQLLPAHGL